MRAILVLAPSLTALGGGVEQHARHLVGSLARLYPDARIDVVLGRERRLRRPELLDEAIRRRLNVRGADGNKRAPRLVELLGVSAAAALRAKPDLILCQHLNYLTLGLALVRLHPGRLVAIAHGIEAWRPLSLSTTRALAACHRVIAVSRTTAERLTAVAPIRRAGLRVINNAVDLARFSPGAPSPRIAERLATVQQPRILTVARLDASERYKGVDVVIDALADLPGARRPGYLVVGDGDDLPRLRAHAAERGVDVRFWGRATDEELPDIYRACDLYVMPSRKEGFGYVFIEALACGVPVVAGDQDGSVDALAGGTLGLLIDPTDARAVSGAIRAQLAGSTPTAMRDPAVLHAAVAARFGLEAFDRRLRDALEVGRPYDRLRVACAPVAGAANSRGRW